MSSLVISKLEYIPIALILEISIGVPLVAAWSIYNGHVSVYMPYISETGTTFPESRLFSMVTAFTSILGALSVCVFYLSVKTWSHKKQVSLLKLNKFALVSGLLTMLGLSMTGIFLLTESTVMHFIGAYFLIAGGNIYGWTNIIISYKFCPRYISPSVIKARVAIMITTMVTTALIIVGGARGYYLFGLPCEGNWSSMKTPDDPGFMYLVISSIGEWLQLGCFVLFSVTFIPHLKKTDIVLQIQNNDKYLLENNNLSYGEVKSKDS